MNHLSESFNLNLIYSYLSDIDLLKMREVSKHSKNIVTKNFSNKISSTSKLKYSHELNKAKLQELDKKISELNLSLSDINAEIDGELENKKIFELHLNSYNKTLIGRFVNFIGEKGKISNFLKQFYFFNHGLKTQISLKDKISSQIETLELLTQENKQINEEVDKLSRDIFKISSEQERLELKLKHGLKAEFSTQPYRKGESKKILRPQLHGIHIPVSFFNPPQFDIPKFRF